MPNDDIIINKANIIGRCIKRINEEYNGNPDNLNKKNHLRDIEEFANLVLKLD